MIVKDLASALGLGPREHVAIVGGGGKTSLMFALAEELRSGGKRVVTTTTTKVRKREAYRSPCVSFIPSDTVCQKSLRDNLDRHGHVFVAQSCLESGKIEGIPAVLADVLYRESQIDYLILEADGAAGRPVKVPAGQEPVIPSSASVVIAMMGLEAIGRKFDAKVVFRLDQFKKVTGLKLGDILTVEALAGIFYASGGLFKGMPESVRRVAFLNKLDLLTSDHEARELVELLLKDMSNPVDPVVIGSIKKRHYLVFEKKIALLRWID